MFDTLCSECCAPIPNLQCGGLCEPCFAKQWDEYEQVLDEAA